MKLDPLSSHSDVVDDILNPYFYIKNLIYVLKHTSSTAFRGTYAAETSDVHLLEPFQCTWSLSVERFKEQSYLSQFDPIKESVMMGTM
jgi:hypothetical protein